MARQLDPSTVRDQLKEAQQLLEQGNPEAALEIYRSLTEQALVEVGFNQQEAAKVVKSTETATKKVEARRRGIAAAQKGAPSRAGKARLTKISPERRSEIARLAANARWKKSKQKQ